MRVLAIDPGYERLGIAVLERERGKERVRYSDCYTTSAALPFAQRLAQLGAEVERVIAATKPDAFAIETLYFTNNQKTALDVASVRGALLYIAAQYNLHIYQYTPLEIKVAVTGYGKSGKPQVTAMVQKLVVFEKRGAHDDEYDAIAVGLTCLAREKP